MPSSPATVLMRRPRALIIPLRLLRMLASFWVACGRWGWILARSARMSPCCFSREARGLNLPRKQRVLSRQPDRGDRGGPGSSAKRWQAVYLGRQVLPCWLSPCRQAVS